MSENENGNGTLGEKEDDGELMVNEAVPKYDADRLYTVEEFLATDWGEGLRMELHDGIAIFMQSPTFTHQRLERRITGKLDTFLSGKPCEVFTTVDVRPNKTEETILEPDIVVICDKSKIINDRYYDGAPDFIVEILSPSNPRNDLVLKFDKYQKAGVKEYWIVDPDKEFVQVNILVEGKYITRRYDKDDAVELTALPGCKIDLREVFAE